MRVSYIADSNIPSRTANSIHVMKMCQAYARHGCNVNLIVPKWTHAYEPGVQDVYSYYGVQSVFPIKKIPFNWPTINSFHRGLLMPFAAFLGSPRFVHTRSISAALGLMEIFRIPTILEIHDVPQHTDRQQRVFERVIRHKQFLSLVVITHALAKILRSIMSDSTKLMVLPDGVDQQSLDTPPSKQEARKILGLENENRCIAVYTGHLYRGRGIELIIQLASQLPDHFFLIVGGQEKNLAEFRDQVAPIPNLRLAGFRPPNEIPTFLQAADVLLMPYGSYVEVRRGGKGGDTSGIASPIKMFEYMAAGKPILASRLPVLEEILKDGVNAMLLPCDEPEPWCAALKHLRLNPELGEMLGHKARSDAREYTWERRAQTLLQSTHLWNEVQRASSSSNPGRSSVSINS